jgi:hypothetical protein
LVVFVYCTLCCQFLWIVHFWLPLRYSLTYICLVSCVSYVSSFSRLFISYFAFGILWCLFVLYLVYPMLPVSLECPFWLSLLYSLTFICLVSSVPYVASFSGLSIFDCPFGILWRLFVLYLVYPMLPVPLDCPFMIVPSVFSNVYLSCIFCTLCFQFLWILHFWLPLRYSLTFFFCCSVHFLCTKRTMTTFYNIHKYYINYTLLWHIHINYNLLYHEWCDRKISIHQYKTSLIFSEYKVYIHTDI